jgi:hypothetical protein
MELALKRASMPTPRLSAMEGVIEDRLYVVVGANSSGDIRSLEVYGPETNRWSSRAPLPEVDDGNAGRYAGAVGVINGELYVAGGWRRHPPFPLIVAYL